VVVRPVGRWVITLLTELSSSTGTPQDLVFNLRYDFPTEWSAIVNVPSNSFNVTTEPGGSVTPLTPNVDLVALSKTS
jgi:hypothetical protein